MTLLEATRLFYTIVLFLLAISVIWIITPYKPFHCIMHGILRWHVPDPTKEIKFNGFHYYSRCRFCKKPIIKVDGSSWYVIKGFKDWYDEDDNEET